MLLTFCGSLRSFHLFKICILIIFTTGIFFSIGTSATASKNHTNLPLATDFPIYPSIKPNVEFWIDIFAKYSKSQGVIHNTERVSIIYEVIQLKTTETVRANKKNRAIKKAVNKKYKNILLRLSKGIPPASKEEKRVAALFGEKPKLSDFRQAAFNIRCQTGLKEEFKKGLARSGAVIESFKKTFQAQGLPEDLVYLPCVESSYNFKAYSKFGAAGIWQFTRSTGKQYMKINYVVDERRDPYLSTIAASRLLKKNYRDLQSWPMAITAYNHGLAGMKRARKKKGSYENIFRSYRSRSFKFASRNFYSEFLAAKEVAKNPDKYFGRIIYQAPLKFASIKTKGYLPIRQTCEALNISINKIKHLNPSLRPPVFNGQKHIPKGFNLKLPDSVSPSRASKALATVYRKKQKPSLFHRVQKGDTASSIARIHSVRLPELMLANQLNRRATIYIGQSLRIPVKDEITLASKRPRISKPPKKDKKIPSKKPAENSAQPILPKALVTDTPVLAVTPTEAAVQEAPVAVPFKEESFINPNIITSNLNVLKTYKKKNSTFGVIKVEAKETLGHYADWLQIPTQDIRTLNKIQYGKPISIDQKIKIPMGKKTVQDFEEQRYEFHKGIEEDFFESFAIQNMEVYKVKNGDTIWSLCSNELEIPLWLVKKYNPEINFNMLHPKQNIHYPVLSILEEN